MHCIVTIHVTINTLTRFEDFWHVLCQKYEFCGAILHEFCKMCAYSVENAAVTGNGVDSNLFTAILNIMRKTIRLCRLALQNTLYHKNHKNFRNVIDRKGIQ